MCINGDIMKFLLLLRNCVYLYEYMNSWEGFDKKPLPEKEAFYSKLNLEDITDEEYALAQMYGKNLN